MQQLYVGTQWKMNKTRREAAEYMLDLKSLLAVDDHVQTFIIVPFTDLDVVRDALDGAPILLGAQNVHWADAGAFTGEISAPMLKEAGVDVVQLGHSERRQFFGETDYTVNQKVSAALRHGLIPLICVGEQLIEREYGVEREVVARQVKIALHGVAADQCSRLWIAYEPVWAIGEGSLPAEPADAAAMHRHIRHILIERFGEHAGSLPPILYGGSISEANTTALLAEPDLDGLFIGRAGLDPRHFAAIVSLAALRKELHCERDRN
jgi:triosephosphate isomerase